METKLIDGVEYVVETIEGKGLCLVPKPQQEFKVGNILKNIFGAIYLITFSESSKDRVGTFSIVVLKDSGRGSYTTYVGLTYACEKFRSLSELTKFAKNNNLSFLAEKITDVATFK